MTANSPAFITLEGIDGAGKSSHLAAIRTQLQEAGVTVVETREPGGTPLGEQLRQMLLHHAMAASTEALLMFAARSEHVEQVIRPALAAGHWVLSDRFSDASVAYQGGGRGLGEARVAVLETWTHPGLRPDLTLLFDLDPAEAARRVRAGRPDQDRFEREQAAFFGRVRQAYLARAAAEPQRFQVLDASRSLPEVADEVHRVVARLLKERRP